MFHSLSTWIIILFTVGIALFCVVMVQGDLDAMADDLRMHWKWSRKPRTLLTGMRTDRSGFIRNLIRNGLREDRRRRIYQLAVTERPAYPACCYLRCDLRKCGAEERICQKYSRTAHNRGILALSKLAASAVQVFIMLLVFILAAGVMGKILWGGRFSFGSLTDMLPFLGAQYLLNLGIAALILFLCILTKSSAFSMTAGIVMVMGLFVPLYSVINRAVYEIRPSWNFDISLYLPDGNIGMAGIHASSEILVRASIVGGAFVVICAAVAALIMQKRDVR